MKKKVATAAEISGGAVPLFVDVDMTSRVDYRFGVMPPSSV
jgi:hypothetical protein